MPESNDSPVTRRSIPVSNRFAAALIDMTVVAVPTILMALALSERFTILDNTAGRPRFAEADQLRINEIDQGFNRAMRLGDTVFTLSGSGWWLTVLLLVTLTAFIFVALPAKLSKRTPGQALLSLPGRVDLQSEGQVENLIKIENLAKAENQLENPAEADAWATEAHKTDTADETADETTSQSETDSPATSEAMASTAVDPTQPEASTKQEADIPSEAHQTVIAAPMTLGDPDDYRAWEKQQASIAAEGHAPNDSRSFDKLALPESSLAESPLNASTTQTAPAVTTTATAAIDAATATTTKTATATATATTETATAATATAAGTAEAPIWSDMWKAWLYWDPASDRWFRHDAEDNSWKQLK